ncbi:hypothetical protein ACSBQT_10805 [Brevibacterium sp. H602]|uniref:hypothetical protein n=1 Tax=Brevibacterium sp. H602 TaxID=3444316 RepID=UPI003EB90F53
MRILVSAERRQSDKFEIRLLAMAMSKYPQFEPQDYEAGIVAYHSQHRDRNMKVGDVIDGARRAYAKRTEVRAIDSGVPDAVPRPSNYRQLRFQYEQINREFKAQGVIPTTEDLLREHARRVREQNS